MLPLSCQTIRGSQQIPPAMPVVQKMCPLGSFCKNKTTKKLTAADIPNGSKYNTGKQKSSPIKNIRLFRFINGCPWAFLQY